MYLMIITIPLFSFLVLIFLGRLISHKGASFVVIYFMNLGTLVSILVFYEVAILDNSCFLKLGNWLSIDIFNVQWTLYYDFLTVGMVLVVYVISTIVHIYSIDYMWGDPHFPRFLSYLSFFTFFMLLLVTSGNILQLFIGWEGVGLASYLLISFWFSRTQASLSSLKAFIVNRIGDAFFIFACSLLFFSVKSFDYSVIFLVAKTQKSSSLDLVFFFKKNFINKHLDVFGLVDFNCLDVICLCFFIGAMSKSAQIFLHTWLPDAMEGPTPVSALIHAATMVAAGVFLVLRFSFLFDLSPNILKIVSIVGGLTCVFSATIGFLQTDLKKVIAYSTCSQLGYMFYIFGLSFYSISFFHLCSHAFFKALLFLSAGSVIHAVGGAQDIRKMGGLLKKLPLTYTSFLVGSIALAGLPFLSGFYSKEAILEFTQLSSNYDRLFLLILGLITALLTGSYSSKIIYGVFFIETKLTKSVYIKVNESEILINFSLVILSILSIFFGFFARDLFIGYGETGWRASGSGVASGVSFFDIEVSFFFQKSLPIVMSMFGIFIGILFWIKFNFIQDKFIMKLYHFLVKKWYFDNLFNFFFNKTLLNVGYIYLYKSLDKGFLELIGPKGLEKVSKTLSNILLKLQTGYVYHYIMYIVVTAVLIPILMYVYKNISGSFSLILLIPIFLIIYYFGDRADKKDTVVNFWGLYVIYLIHSICYLKLVLVTYLWT